MGFDTPIFAGFHIKTLGKKRLGTSQKMVGKLVKLKEKDLSQLAECFRSFIPDKKLQASDSKAHSRQRIFSKRNTFWAFFSQVIDADGTGISIPDTSANQEEWPQQSQQKEGCGFPTARICTCFPLATEGLLSFKVGNKKVLNYPYFVNNGIPLKKEMFFLETKGSVVITVSSTSRSLRLIL